MNKTDVPNPIMNDVLRAPAHTALSKEQIEKAVARHTREHPVKPEPAAKSDKKRSK